MAEVMRSVVDVSWCVSTTGSALSAIGVNAGKGKSLVAAGKNLVESSVPVLIDIGRANIGNFQTSLKLETKLMIILPRIKADYDDYIHF